MSGAPTSQPTARFRTSVVCLGLPFLVLVGACSESLGSSTSADPSASSTTATNPTSSTTAPTSSTTEPTGTTSTTNAADLEDDVIEVWSEFWNAWAQVRNSEDLNPEPLRAVAEAAVVEGATSLFERQHATSGPIETEVVTHPNVTIEGSGAVVEDCVLIRPSFTETVGVWYEAALQNGADGWRVTDLDIRSSQGCVPAALNSAAIDAYEAYYEATSEFWDPPDPDHALVAETFAEPQLSFMRDLLRQHAERDVAYRQDPTLHPEVVEVRSAAEMVILDCLEPGQNDGLYEQGTGERVPGDSVVRAGQRNLRSAVMVFEDGKWKVSDFQGQVDFECDFAPTERGLPSV